MMIKKHTNLLSKFFFQIIVITKPSTGSRGSHGQDFVLDTTCAKRIGFFQSPQKVFIKIFI